MSWANAILRRPLLGSPETRSRVLHGDWHPLVRDPLDVLRLHYVAGAIVMFAIGHAHAAWQLVFSAVAVLFIRAIDPPRKIDLAFIVAMMFNGWGDALHLFSKLSWYDNLVHTTLPFSVGPLAYIGLMRMDVVAGLRLGDTHRHRIGVVLVTFALGVTGSAAYEIYEYSVDHYLGQHLVVSEADTVTDLADGFLGAFLGGLLLASLLRPGARPRRLPHGSAQADDGRERPAEPAVEDDPRRGAEGGPHDERARGHARGAEGVIEGADRHRRQHAQHEDAAGAASLEPPDERLGTLREPPRNVASAAAPEQEGGQRAERAADERQEDPEGPEEDAPDGAQKRAGDERAGARDPEQEEAERSGGAGRVQEARER